MSLPEYSRTKYICLCPGITPSSTDNVVSFSITYLYLRTIALISNTPFLLVIGKVSLMLEVVWILLTSSTETITVKKKTPKNEAV